MMIETVKELLSQVPQDGYEITEEREKGWEFYFIRHQLDQHRVRDIKTLKVKVYRKSEDGQFLGSAVGEIPPTATRREAEETIRQLSEQALLVKNPVYTLTPKADIAIEQEAVSPERMAEDYLLALHGVEENAAQDINSYEIFARQMTRRLVTSGGLDVSFTYPSSMAEVVVNARDEKEEIELYRMYTSGTCDAPALKRQVEETLRFGHDRLGAVSTPALGKADVVLSTDAAVSVYEYFINRLAASYKLRKISDWEVGKDIAADAAGDKVSIQAVAVLPNSSANFPVDEEGAKVEDAWLMKGNVPERFWGGRQFCQYLGIEENCQYANFIVSGGREGAEALRQGDFLEIVEFSDFQTDPMTGDIAGEIRLGYLHRGGKVQVVTGGSVSGSMTDFIKGLRFSKEQRQYDSLLIPAVTRLPGVSITGAE